MRWWLLTACLLTGCIVNRPVIPDPPPVATPDPQFPTTTAVHQETTSTKMNPSPTPFPTTTPDPCTILPDRTLTYLALGDSYTIGEAVPADESWPAQLAQLLRDRGATIDDPTILATTGWTSGELLSRLERVTFLRAEYDLVSLLIGVNNQYRGGDLETFRRELVILLNRAITLAGNNPQRLLVLSIPDYSITPFAATRDPAAIAANLVQFNEIVRHEAGTAGTHYIDITPLSLQAAGRPDLLATDGLHPSGAMYALWVDAVLPSACVALSVAP